MISDDEAQDWLYVAQLEGLLYNPYIPMSPMSVQLYMMNYPGSPSLFTTHMSLMEESGGSSNDKVAEVPAEPALAPLAEPAPAPLPLEAPLPVAFDDEFTPHDAMTMLYQCLHVDATNDAMVHECQGGLYFFSCWEFWKRVMTSYFNLFKISVPCMHSL